MARAAACALARSGALAVMRPRPSEASVNARNTRISSWKVSRPSLKEKKENKREDKGGGKGGKEGPLETHVSVSACSGLFRDARCDTQHALDEAVALQEAGALQEAVALGIPEVKRQLL